MPYIIMVYSAGTGTAHRGWSSAPDCPSNWAMPYIYYHGVHYSKHTENDPQLQTVRQTEQCHIPYILSWSTGTLQGSTAHRENFLSPRLSCQTEQCAYTVFMVNSTVYSKQRIILNPWLFCQTEKCGSVPVRVVDPDPDSITLWIRIQWLCGSGLGIRVPDPDPGQENEEK
jgi:hypothetical protein